MTYWNRKIPARCGTDSGYYRHLRVHHEPACDACKAAHADTEARRQRHRPRDPGPQRAAIIARHERVEDGLDNRANYVRFLRQHGLIAA